MNPHSHKVLEEAAEVLEAEAIHYSGSYLNAPDWWNEERHKKVPTMKRLAKELRELIGK